MYVIVCHSLSVVDAPSLQSSEVKIDGTMEKSSYQNYFTAPPLLWTVLPLDACAQSQNNAQDRAHTRGRNAKPEKDL